MDSTLLYGAVGGILATGIGVIALRTFFPWLKYDWELIKGLIQFAYELKEITGGDRLVIDYFEENAKRLPEKPFLIYDDVEFTFQMVDEQASRVANVMKTLDIKTGDTVGIMIYNEPAFVWTYLGLQKMGIVPALINHNVRKDGLLRCIRDSEARILILGEGKELLNAVYEVKSDLCIPVYIHGPEEHIPREFVSFEKLMADSLPVSPNKATRANINNQSISEYIFTSGTTGLPKAAFMRHLKSKALSCLLRFGSVSEDDIIYLVLPLYHTSAIIPSARAMKVGCTIVLKKKFSVSQFWDDCRKHGVTVVSYVGEVLRYLLTPPELPTDKDHKVRLVFGNGLRTDIWEMFQRRFGIKIIEFYGATEGLAFFINVNNKPGALGRLSPIINLMSKSINYLVKYDVNTVLPLRDENGRCTAIECGEVGLLINDTKKSPYVQPEREMEFYKGRKEESEKKKLRNCFAEGDVFFNSGDTFYLDNEYFLYFNDRLGDTFRWKGENVSTTEVANSLKELDYIEDANVYGVQIPGCEGRAGMAAIYFKDKRKLITDDVIQQTQESFESHLPGYARPVFLRFPKEIHLTATFKQQKSDFRKEGYDPNIVTDPLYYKAEGQQRYIPLTKEIFSKIK